MGDLIQRLAWVSRPARIGLVAAASVLAGTAGATFIARDPQQAAPPSLAVGDTEGSDAVGGAELEQGPTPIELEVDPENLDWLEENSVEISGTTAIDAQDPWVALTVVSPTGHSYRLEPVPVGSDGSFATTFELNRLEPEADAPPGTPLHTRDSSSGPSR